jgi:hypothetical protein
MTLGIFEPANRPLAGAPIDHAPEGPSKKLYRSLFQPDAGLPGPSAPVLEQARTYLREQLTQVEQQHCDLPADPAEVGAWIKNNVAQVGEDYRAYLAQRKLGGARRFFPTRSHALHFLGTVAPTKLVDGSWLYGLSSHWRDARFLPLIRTYLEELGEGVPDRNHVALYKRLLAAQDCEHVGELDDDCYRQGVIQLALAYLADDFLPEVVGFNLGYEQLPLHLPITAYELDELGIDPYYFTLHVTVDNADVGHAQKALQGLTSFMRQSPLAGDAAEFYRRVRNGFKLNGLGPDSTAIIDNFTLDAEVEAIFVNKAAIGSMMHSDYCSIGGRTVNAWLSDPSRIPAMLEAFQQAGWIKRHQPLSHSRFWKLIQGDRAAMFGVFSGYERQVISDWIVGDAAAAMPRPLSFRARRRLLEQIAPVADSPGSTGLSERSGDSSLDAEVRALEQDVAASANRDEAMALLIRNIGPNTHWNPVGLCATRLFERLLTA